MTDHGRATADSDPIAPAAPASVRTAGWAVYLATSWTWCIGMFLPVLLVRDMGAWAFAVFAVPNVLGAAAMGWVLAGPGASRRFVTDHAPACRAFSLVTIAFHVFFTVYMFRLIGGSIAWPGIVAAVIVVACFGAARANPARLLTLAAAVLGASAVCAMTLSGAGELSFDVSHAPVSLDVLLLAPVCVFGFALCPYLDLTFHRARQEAPGAIGNAAFGIGFLAVFAGLILLTFAYRDLLLNPQRLEALPGYVGGALAVHLLAQTWLTVMLHRNEWAAQADKHSVGVWWATVLAAPLLLGLLASPQRELFGLSMPEVIYRCFMAFYGLVFPAYVWICAIPTRDGRSGPSPEKLRVFLFAVGAAAPMFAMGFIGRQMIWLAPGLLVVLLARLAARRGAA